MAKNIRLAKTFPDGKKAKLVDLITAWNDASKAAALAAQTKKEAQAALVDAFFSDDDVGQTGTHTIRTEYGMDLKVSKSISLSVDSIQLDALVETAGDNVKGIVEDFITYKPSASKSEWDKLSDDDRKLFADVITEKNSAPQVKLQPIAS